jgi:hypothetical protein
MRHQRYVIAKALKDALDPVYKFFDDWDWKPPEDMNKINPFANGAILDLSPTLLLNAATQYSSLRQDVATWVRPVERDLRYQQALEAMHAFAQRTCVSVTN